MDPHRASLAEFTMARALWESGRDRRSAVKLAGKALAAADGDDDLVAEIRSWLELRDAAPK
jgi:hypothetical protein